MKKILSLALACLMLIASLAGCGTAAPAAGDVASVKTIGEAMKLEGTENTENSLYSHYYVYVAAIGGTTYRFIADMDEETTNALFDLDWGDPDSDAKIEELSAPLKIIRIDNVTEGIPAQADLDKLVGKTVGELLEGDWSYSGYDLDQKVVYLSKTGYECEFSYEGEPEVEEPEEDDLSALTVKSAKFLSISDATYLELDDNGDLVK